MKIKSSKVNNRKNVINKSIDTIIMNTDTLHCFNENTQKNITPNVKNIIISKKLVEDTYNIEIYDSSATTLYFEGFTNFGDITIPIDYFNEEELTLYIINEENIECKFKKINIINDNKRLYTINLEDNLKEIIIRKDQDEYDLYIYLRTNKNIIEYFIDKNNGCFKLPYRYFISESDLDKNKNLDLRNMLDYESIFCEKIDINTLIVDKRIFNKNQILKNNPNIKHIRFVDDNEMKLIPFDKSFLVSVVLLYETNCKYLYIKTNDDEVVIYLDKNNQLKFISKKELLNNNDIENIYFRFRKQNRVNGGILEPLNLIIKEYKDGRLEIFDLNNEINIDDEFKKNIFLNIEQLRKFNVDDLNYIKNNKWLELFNSINFSNNLFNKICVIHLENKKIKEKAKSMGLSSDAINYLYSRGILNTIIKNKLIQFEVEGFNDFGENYKKILKK